ncbi:MAG: lipid II flippase MurJ [Patescibacteria group bacterium]
MVKRILSLLGKEIGNLHEAAYLLGFFAILSQLLALFRDRLLAYTFGAGATLDIYYAAFRIPDLLFISVGSIVSVSVLVPFLLDRAKNSEAESRQFVSQLATAFLAVIVCVGALAWWLSPALTLWFFPGITGDDHIQLTLFTRILLFSPILLGLSNCLGSITQAYRRFVVYALSPLVYNLGIIFGIVVLYPKIGTKGLVYGVVFGALLHVLVQVPSVRAIGRMPQLVFRGSYRVFTEVMAVSLPRTLTLGLSQIAILFLMSLASQMAEGSIAVFTFALNLQSVPLSIIGVSYSLAAFPALSKLHTDGNTSAFFTQLATAARHILFWSIPITLLFIVLRAHIVRVVLGAGEFTWSDTRLTAATLALFVVSVVAQSLVLLFVRAYYARGETRRPLQISVYSTLIIILSSIGLSHLFVTIPSFHYFLEALFRVSDVAGTKILVLPLAFTIGMSVNALYLWWGLKPHSPIRLIPLRETFFQSVSASIIMGFVTYLSLNYFSTIFSLTTTLGLFLQAFCSAIIGIVAWVGILKALNSPELSEMWTTLHRKIWKTGIVTEEIGQL